MLIPLKPLARVPAHSAIAVAASGSYSWLVDEMERSGHRPKLCNPLEAKRRMGLTKKTDMLDARGLAILLRNGTLPEVWIPPSELRDQRELLRLRIFLVRLRTRVKNRIHGTLSGLIAPAATRLVARSPRIPQITVLKTRTPNSILRTLKTGAMMQQVSVLSAGERQLVAWLGKPVTMEVRHDQISNSCPAGAVWKNTPGCSGWSPGLVNTRFQSAQDAVLSAADVPRLQPKWVFAFPDTTLLRSQPAVYRERVFVGSQDGTVYALDAVFYLGESQFEKVLYSVLCP
jgi:hypothetical protein